MTTTRIKIIELNAGESSFHTMSCYVPPKESPEPDEEVTTKDNVIIDINGVKDNNPNNHIVKVELTYDYDESENCPVSEVYNYNLTPVYRGNMLQMSTSDNNNIPKIFKHEYCFSSLGTPFKTLVNIYMLNGAIITRKLIINPQAHNFATDIGDLKILNTQYIDNDYNYLFLIAETKNGQIVQFSLEQKANRGQAIRPLPDDELEITGNIVKITDENAYLYLCTNSEPIYLCVSPEDWPTYRRLASIQDYKNLIKTILNQIDIVQIKGIEDETV